jgi:hypothetical protein
LAAACAGPLLVVLVCYGLLLYSLLAGFHFNPSGPIRIGSAFDGQRFWDETTLVQPGVGYDGQFFYYLARDPLLQAPDPAAFLDRPAYRYARVLYPWLSWAAALGQAGAIPWALLGVNLTAVLIGTAATVDLLRSLGGSRWLALAFALSPAPLLGFIADLAEPSAFALIALGLAFQLRRRHWSTGLALAAATLAREVSFLVPLAFMLQAIWRREWRTVRAYALPLLLPLAWHLLIWLRLGALPSSQSPTNFGLPFSGALYRAGVLLGWQTPLLGEPASSGPLPELLIIGMSVLLILLGLTRFVKQRDVYALQLWLQAAAALCTTPLVWIGLGSYGRVLGLLYLFFGLALLAARRSPIAAPAVSTEAVRTVPGATVGGRLRLDHPRP